MIDSETYFTVIYKDLPKEERVALLNNRKFAAAGHSHAFDDRDQLLNTLCHVEEALVGLTLEGDHRVLPLLTTIRNVLKGHGRFPKVETQSNHPLSYTVGEIECRLTEDEVSILASALEIYAEKSDVFEGLRKKIEDLYEDHCVKYSLSPAMQAYHEKYGTWGVENEVEEARWEGFRDAYLALNLETE